MVECPCGVWPRQAPPIELGRHDGAVRAVTATADRGVISGGADGRVLAWGRGKIGGTAIELERHEGGVRAVAASPDGRVVTVGADERVCLLDLARPGRTELWRRVAVCISR
jgi:WD40 repeat protein